MKKRVIALAVASLVSGTAFAQSAPTNVTVYGIVDMGYHYYSDPIVKGTKSMSAIDSGDQSPSRFGFKGTEDLGDGLSANFDAVFTFSGDVNSAITPYRKTFVGLTSTTFGQIKAGQFATFEDDLVGATNVMAGNTTVGQPSKVYLAGSSYYNAVGYFSPVWNGLQLRAAFSSADKTGDVEPLPLVPTDLGQQKTAKTNQRHYAIAAHYNNGPLIGGATYEINKYQDVSGQTNGYDSGNVWHLFGAYDFKVVRVNAAYGTYNYAANDVAIEKKDTRKQWQLGVSTPVGEKGLLALNYAHANIKYRSDATPDDKQGFWGVGFFYNLSKRTNFYTAYGKINQDDSNQTANKAGWGVGSTASYNQAFSAGLRHQF